MQTTSHQQRSKYRYNSPQSQLRKKSANRFAKSPQVYAEGSLRGEVILGSSEVDGFYREGVVLDNEQDALIFKENSTGNETKIPIKACVLLNKVSDSGIKMNDYVLVRVWDEKRDEICYIPGKVVSKETPSFSSPEQKFCIELFQGSEHVTRREKLVKISLSLYVDAIKSILSKKAKNLSNTKKSTRQGGPRERSHKSRTPANTSETMSPAPSLKSEGDYQEILKTWCETHEKSLEQQTIQINSLIDCINKEIKQLRSSQRELSDSISNALEKGVGREELQLLQNDVTRLNEAIKELEQQRLASQEAKAQAHEHSNEGLEEDNLIGLVAIAEIENNAQYMKGQVVEKCGNDYYTLKGENGQLFHSQVTTIYTTHLDDLTENVEDQTILAPLSNDANQYAPGVVLKTEEDAVLVRFCDGLEKLVERQECFLISEDVFEGIVKKIKEQENYLWGSSVVARDDRTGYFLQGTLLSFDEKGNQNRYNILLPNAEIIQQRSIHIFRHGVVLKIPQEWEKVLAKWSQEDCFLPGWILDYHEESASCTVHFYHGKQEIVDLRDIIPVLDEYYQICVEKLRHNVE